MYYITKKPTARQLEVLQLLANGFSQTQIAKKLQITPDTVAAHIKRTKHRLKARTLPHAVILCLQNKYIT